MIEPLKSEEMRPRNNLAPTALRYRGQTVRLKWHKLRRRLEDPLFARQNLGDGLAPSMLI